MMKKLGVILSVVVAVMLTVTLLVPMFASAAVPKDVLEKMEFVAYRVLDRDQSTLPTDNAPDNNKVYTVNKDFAEFFKNITPENYEKGIHKSANGDRIWITVENGILTLVPGTTTVLPSDVIVLPVNKDVTANSEDVLAGVLLSAMSSSSAKASDAQRLAGWLKDYAVSKKDVANWPNHQDPTAVVNVIEGEDGNGKLDIGDLKYGYWLVYAKNTDGEDIKGISNVKVVLEVGEGSPETIEVKAEYDGLEKTVRNMTDKDDTYDKTAQADAGDILEYEVKFNIQPLDDYPSNNDIDITELQYVITDTLTNQRLVNYIDTTKIVEGASPYKGVFLLEININGKTYYYTDVESSSLPQIKEALGLGSSDILRALVRIRKDQGGINYGNYVNGQQKFSITFDWNSLQDLLGEYGATVVLKYKAELTSDAILKNPNKVELKYSNNPSDYTDFTTNEDNTIVYSYGLDITKTFDGGAGNVDLWKDVVFNLYEASLPTGGTIPTGLVAAETPIAFIEKEDGTPGDYQRADLSDRGNQSYDLKLKATEEGGNTLNIYGLDPGYYVLEETKSPNGYLLGGKVYIYITADGTVLNADGSALWLGKEDISDGGIIGAANTYDEKDLEQKNPLTSSLQITINNKKRDFQLPETGDIGVWLFGIGSVVVLAGAAFVYSELKKKSRN